MRYKMNGCLLAIALGIVPMVHAESTTTLDDYLSQYESIKVCRVFKKSRSKTVTISSSNRHRIKHILDKGGYLGPCADFGDKRSMGDGYFETYVQLNEEDTPWGIGYAFPAATLNNLPTTKNDGQNCFDVNGNGTLEEDGSVNLGNPLHHDECVAGHQRVLDFPHKDKIYPFKWALLNYQSHGHSPEGVYDTPHFDFHFFTMDFIKRNYIRVGSCGLLMNCDDYQKAMVPVAPGYLHPDFINVGAAEARMGNHLVDVTSGEWHGQEYTETWIYGSYDGEIIFWEPMITLAYLLNQPYECKDLKLPEAYMEAGYYPTQYCMRYLPGRDEYRISLEGFTYREAF